MRNAHSKNWYMARKLTKKKNAKNTCKNQEYGKKHSKTQKMRNAHSRTWNMVRKLKIMKNDKHKLQDIKYGLKTLKKKSDKEKSTLQDREYDEKSENN